MNRSTMILLLTLGAQLRVWHWQTKSYAEHKALGKLYDTLSDLTDTLMEAGIVIPSLGPVGGTLTLTNYTNKQAVLLALTSATESLRGMQATSELLNIRDELVQAIDQCTYLLGLT